MDRNWLNHYPPGVPADIDPDSYPSLKEAIEEAFSSYRTLPAFTNMGATLTYAQLDELSRAFAAWLQHKSGLVRGDRVALMMPNILQYPIALFGALRAGMVVVNTNPLYTPRELEHQLKDSGAKAIVIVENFAHVLQQVLARTDLKNVLRHGRRAICWVRRRAWIVNFVLRHVRKQVPAWRIPGSCLSKRSLGSGLGLKMEPVSLGPEDIAFLQYTGGTTGRRQGRRPHPPQHGGELAAVAGMDQAGAAGRRRPHRDHRAAAVSHLCAHQLIVWLFLPLGARNVLITNPRDFPAFVAELKKYKFNFISGVNTLFNALLHTPGFESVDFSALRATFAGGMAMQPVVAARWKEVTGNIVSARLGAHRDLADGAPPIPSDCLSMDRSACRCPQPMFPFAMTPARNCPSTASVKSVYSDRR